jgi:hypothetical protein
MARKIGTNKAKARVNPNDNMFLGVQGPLVLREYLRRVGEIRSRQLDEGHFDCYAKAWDGYCDRGDCAYRQECLLLSGLSPEFKAGLEDLGRIGATLVR